MSQRFHVDGVPEGGVIVGDIGQEVPESVICSYFGPRSSKSGWKYQLRTSPEEQDQILSLYQRVYESQDIPNKEISVQFARGLILMSEGSKVDWEEFRVSRRKYRESLRKRKELTRVVKSEREGLGSVPSVIGKRRCLATQGAVGDDFPLSLKLSVKPEVVGEGFVATMGKRGSGKGRVPNLSPSWTEADIGDMVEVIADRSKLLESFRFSLSEVTKVKGEKENSLRRARLMQEDRMVMIRESLLEIEKIDSEELSVRALIEERSMLLESLGSGDKSVLEKETLVAQLSHDEGKCEALCAARVDEQRSCKRSRQIVEDSEQTICRLEKELELTCSEHGRLEQKVEASVSQMSVMEEQLRMMREGFGECFWPVPIANCPERPVQLVHTLNPCPVCHLWYSCFDYVPISCGHCYHPWCLASHAKLSSKCLVPDCEEPFLRRHQVSLGIRAPVKPLTSIVKKEVLQASHSSPAAHFKPKDSTVVSSCEEGERIPLGSQASETNVPTASHGCVSREENVSSKCVMCKTRPQAVRLKACGHNTCFGCVNGLGACPTCKEPILGWEAIRHVRSVHQVAEKTGAVEGVAVSSNPARIEDSDTKGVVPMACPEETRAEIEEGDEYSDEDDNINDGLVHYCDDATFSQGGMRSRSVELIMAKQAEEPAKQAEEQVYLSGEEEQQTQRPARPCEELATPETSSDPVNAGEPLSVVKKSRSGRKVEDDDCLNSTRIVKRTMNEILGLGCEEEPAKKKPGRPRSSTKKKDSDSLGQGLRLPRNGTGRQTVPAKFRDM